MNFFQKIWRDKLSKAWFVTACVLLAFISVFNLVATQNSFIYNTINSVLGGERRKLVSGDPEQYQYYTADYKNKQATLAAANALNEEIVEEGITLLKNESSLPLSSGSRISVFGKNSVNLVYGGSGSGGASAAGAVTLYESLSKAGFEANPALKSFYENNSKSGSGRPSSPAMGDVLAGFATGETPVSSYSGISYDGYKDAALIVISRIGGEGYDLPRTMKESYADGAKAISGANADDHYLRLDNNERDLVSYVKAQGFSNICVIVNSATPIELGELQDDDGIKSILWIGSVGKTGINALGRVLNGSVNPSGKTVDTYVRDFTKDPSWQNFGNNNVTDGNRYFVDGKKRAYYFVEYEEGIYVGYRYWETRAVEEANGETWYADNVVYPMGYGLSYTEFAWQLKNKAEIESASYNEKSVVTLEVEVSNTGSVPGKEVVEIYLTAPYTKGGIEKAHVVLVGFEKTPMLYPEGDSRGPNSATVSIEVPVYYFASYDYNDANGNGNKGYEIEAGDYQLKVSRNAHEVEDVATVSMGAILVQDDTTTGNTVTNRFDDVSNELKQNMSRADFAGTFPTSPTDADRNVTQSFIDSLTYQPNDTNQKWSADVAPKQSNKTLSYNATTVKLSDLLNYENGVLTVDYNDPLWDELLDQLTVKQMIDLIGTGNYNTSFIENIAKPRTTDPDGPVGFTAFMGDPSVYDTCFYASGCVLGATYNKDLAFRMGEMVGNEGLIGDERGDGRPYSGWYAPAVNIHRSQFSGRNWEYYSEDGYLSGIMAAHVVKGASSKGVYAYVKHFALNDQETNRSNNGILTWANEQAMREIYLRAFELTVKEGHTSAIMSSFNRIGKTWSGGSYELLTEVLRNEWGFNGMVVTDYNYATPYMNVDQMIRAGGDINLSQANYPSNDMSPTQIANLRRATKNILYTVAGSNAMNGSGQGVVYKYTAPTWVIIMVVVDVALIAILALTGFFAVKRAFKKAENN